MDDRFFFSLGCENTYMPEEFDGDVYHYTSPEGFEAILFDDPHEMNIWASRYDCLNDISEGKLVEKRYQSVCSKLLQAEKISREFYELIAELHPDGIKMLTRYVNGVYQMRGFPCDCYICSFSTDSDSLPMWNYYSKNIDYEGFNVGFYGSELKKGMKQFFHGKDMEGHLYKVVYDRADQERLMERFLLDLQAEYRKQAVISNAELQDIITTHLTKWKLIFKNECFGYEKEVRIIVDVARQTPNHARPVRIKYRITNGYTVPYIEIKFDRDCLLSVCVGPLQCPDDQKQVQRDVMQERLEDAGYETKQIAYSEIPIRF